LKAQQEEEAKAKRDEAERKRVAALTKEQREAELFGFLKFPVAAPQAEQKRKKELNEKETNEKEVKEKESKEKESKQTADQRRVAASSTLAESARTAQSEGDEELQNAIAFSLEKPKESQEEAAKENYEQVIDKELKAAVDVLEKRNAALSRQFIDFINSLRVIVRDRNDPPHEINYNYYKEIFEKTEGKNLYVVINALERKIQGSGQQNYDADGLDGVIYLALFSHAHQEYERIIRDAYNELDRLYTDTIYRILLNKRAVENEIKHARDKGQEPQERLIARKGRLDKLLMTISQGHEACIVPIAQFKAAMVKRTLVGVKDGGDFRLNVPRGDLMGKETKRPLRGDQVFAKMQSGPTISSQIAAMSDRDFYIPAVRKTLRIKFRDEKGADAGGLRREFVGAFLEPYFSAVDENKDADGHDVISQWFFDHDKDLTYALPKDLSEVSKKAELKEPDKEAIKAAQEKIEKLEQEQAAHEQKLATLDAERTKLRQEYVGLTGEEEQRANLEKTARIFQERSALDYAFFPKKTQLKAARELLNVPKIKQEYSTFFDNYQTALKALGRVLLLSLANDLPVVLPLPSSSFLTILEGIPSVTTIERLHLLIQLLYEYSPDACGPFLDMIIEYEKTKREGKSEAVAARAFDFLAEDALQQGTSWWVVLNRRILKQLHVFDEDGKPSRSLRMMNEGLSIPASVIAENDGEKVEASEQKLATVAKFLVGGVKLPQATLVHELQVELLPEVICMHVSHVWYWLSPADCVYGLFSSEIDAKAVKKGLQRRGFLEDQRKSNAAALFMEAVGEYLDDNTKRVDEKTSEDLDSPEERMRKQRALGDFVQFLCGARAYDGRVLELDFHMGGSRGAAYDAHSCFGKVDIFIDTVIDQLAPHRKDSSALDALPVPKLEKSADKKSFKEAVKANIAQYWKGDFYSHS
jgi:hypothetical protein